MQQIKKKIYGIKLVRT